MRKLRYKLYQIIWLIIGIFLIGLSYGVFYHLDAGSLPITTLIEAVAPFVKNSFILAGWLVHIAFFIPLIIYFKRLMGLTSIAYSVFLGISMELGIFLIRLVDLFSLTFEGRLLAFILSCIFTGLGLAITLSLDGGILPYESTSLLLSEKFKISFTLGNGLQDGIIIILGVLLGANFGWGTIGTFLMGHLLIEVWIYMMNTFIHKKTG